VSSRPVVLGALCAFLLPVMSVVALAGLVASQSRADCARPISAPAGASQVALAEIPHWLLPVYAAAAARYGLGPGGWAYLASINEQETAFGRDLQTSSTGAEGWMQFEPETFARYGVSADPSDPGAPPDPYDPWDATYAAASYLQASGAPGDWAAAIYAYNHASWYVAQVEARANTYLASPGVSTLEVGGGGAPRNAGCALEAGSNTLASRVEAAADELAALAVPYVFGGGHVTPARPDPGLDCSSSVSWVLQHAGMDVATMTSGEYESWGGSGVGHYVTIYANPEHVFMAIRSAISAPWRYFGTSGFGHPDAPNGTGPAWFTVAPSAEYVAGFVARHPVGL
jgi:cell wall-associated NlpC family hydrolase